MDGRPNGGGFLAFAIGGLDAGDRVGDGREHVLGVASPRSSQNFEHGGLEVPPLLLRIPGPQGRLGDDVQDGGDGWELASVNYVEPCAVPLARSRRDETAHARPPAASHRGRTDYR